MWGAVPAGGAGGGGAAPASPAGCPATFRLGPAARQRRACSRARWVVGAGGGGGCSLRLRQPEASVRQLPGGPGGAASPGRGGGPAPPPSEVAPLSPPGAFPAPPPLELGRRRPSVPPKSPKCPEAVIPTKLKQLPAVLPPGRRALGCARPLHRVGDAGAQAPRWPGAVRCS